MPSKFFQILDTHANTATDIDNNSNYDRNNGGDLSINTIGRTLHLIEMVTPRNVGRNQWHIRKERIYLINFACFFFSDQSEREHRQC